MDDQPSTPEDAGQKLSGHSQDEEFPLAVLEEDENIPPRPEEELADLARSEPAPHGFGTP